MSNEKLKFFSKRLKIERKACGYSSAKHLAKALNTALGTVGNWERGKNFPTVTQLIALCDLLSTSPDSLLGFTANQKSSPLGYTIGDIPSSLLEAFENLAAKLHYTTSAELVRRLIRDAVESNFEKRMIEELERDAAASPEKGTPIQD